MPEEQPPLEIPIPGEGDDDVATEATCSDSGDDVATEATCSDSGDLESDCLNLLLEDMETGHNAFMEDAAQNEETIAAVLDFATSKKFNEVGPIEAAASEVIMRIKP